MTMLEHPTAATDLAETTAQAAQKALRGTQRAALSTYDRLSGRVDAVRSQAGPAMHDLARGAEDLVHRGRDAVRHGSHQVRGKALDARDATVSYIRHEPIKSVLIAAGIGAALWALASLLRRSGDDR